MSLKSQITGLNNILDKGRIDKVYLNLWMKRLTDLYHAFEENKLVVLDSNERHNDEFANVQERYFFLAARVENILHTANDSETSTRKSIDKEQSDNTGHATLITNGGSNYPKLRCQHSTVNTRVIFQKHFQ